MSRLSHYSGPVDATKSLHQGQVHTLSAFSTKRGIPEKSRAPDKYLKLTGRHSPGINRFQCKRTPADPPGPSAPHVYSPPSPALPKEQGPHGLSSNQPLSEQDLASKEAETGLNFVFPPFSTTRSVFRSDGKGIWRDRLRAPRRARVLTSHLSSQRRSELRNSEQPWKTSQHPQQAADPRVHIPDTPHPGTTSTSEARNTPIPENI